jgi:hypothetical protein
VKDPKLLLSVIEHARRAIEDASEAIISFHISRADYELTRISMRDDGKHDTMAAFADLMTVRRPDIKSASEAQRLYHDLQLTLQQHKEAPVAFQRDEKLVIAGEGFSYLKEVTPSELKKSLATIKTFVHSCHQHIALKDEKTDKKQAKHDK